MRFLIVLLIFGCFVSVANADCVQGRPSEYGGICCSTVTSDISADIIVKRYSFDGLGMKTILAWIDIGIGSGQGIPSDLWIQIGASLEPYDKPMPYLEIHRSNLPDKILYYNQPGWHVHVEIRRIAKKWVAFLNGKEMGSILSPAAMDEEMLVESQGDCADTGLFIFKNIKIDGRFQTVSPLVDPGFDFANISNGFVVSVQPRET